MSETETTEPDVADAELVAQRSADVAEDSSDEHVKVFVLPPGPKPTEANGFSHEANFAATRQYAISQGLRPTGDVRHVSTEPFGPGGKSWALTYAVPAVPAERFDFETVRVLTEHETGEDGHASTTPEGTGAPAPSDADAKASAEAKEADNAKAAADADANFDENSPNDACMLRSSISPNVAMSQNAVAPPLPRRTSHPSGRLNRSVSPSRTLPTSFFTGA